MNSEKFPSKILDMELPTQDEQFLEELANIDPVDITALDRIAKAVDAKHDCPFAITDPINTDIAFLSKLLKEIERSETIEHKVELYKELPNYLHEFSFKWKESTQGSNLNVESVIERIETVLKEHNPENKT